MNGTEEIYSEYQKNLHSVIKSLKRNISYVAIAGPTLYGEKPKGHNKRDIIYDHYVTLNAAITAEENVTFVDTRSAFFENLPKWWWFNSHYLTLVSFFFSSCMHMVCYC